MTTPERTADCINALGVHIQLSRWVNATNTVLTDTAYLGVTHVRDHGPTPATPPAIVAGFGALAAAGLSSSTISASSH
jgi:hypothetical protein